jgi:hypothetical protein
VWQVQTKSSSLFFQILWDGCELQICLLLVSTVPAKWLMGYDFTQIHSEGCLCGMDERHKRHKLNYRGLTDYSFIVLMCAR